MAPQNTIQPNREMIFANDGSTPEISTPRPKRVPPFAKEIIAGSLGGICQIIASHPLDVLKTRLQSQSAKTAAFESPMQSIRRTFQLEGFLGFYKGVSAPIVAASFTNAILFSVNGKMRRIVGDWFGVEKLQVPHIILASEMTAPFYCLATTPADLLKSRLQIQSTADTVKYKGLIDCFTKIVREEGVMALQRGYLPTTMTRFVGLPFYFGGYEVVKDFLEEKFVTNPRTDRLQWTACNMIAGATGGVLFFTTAFPFDVCKIYIQTRDEPMTMLQAFRQIYTDKGIGGLYKGFKPTIARAIVANSVVFVAVARFRELVDSAEEYL